MRIEGPQPRIGTRGAVGVTAFSVSSLRAENVEVGVRPRGMKRAVPVGG